jgi:hypothetical protein
MKLTQYIKSIKDDSIKINYLGAEFIIYDRLCDYAYIATNRDGDIVMFYEEPVAMRTSPDCDTLDFSWVDKTYYIDEGGELLYRRDGNIDITDWRNSLRKMSDIIV